MSQIQILVVEDDVVNQEIISEFLTFSGIQVDLAEDGVEALNCVRDKQYDIIIMDLMMPNLDGLAATRAIRAMTDTQRANTPIIAATARDPIAEQQAWLEAGINDYVHKPFSEDELWNVINRFV
jgi:CheY-like chemotaxis protein